MSFTDKVVIITGAGSGIGKAIAQHFAKESAILSLFDINIDNLNKVSEKCENLSKRRVLRNIVDVTKDEELKQGIVSTVEELERIDILINCAGIFGYGGILRSSILDLYDRVLKINLRSVLAATHFALPELIKTKGCIVNISSVMGKIVSSNELVYNISKAAVTHLTKCIALELADKGVRINCVAPGPVKTNLLVQDGINQERSEILMEYFLNCNPIKHRMTTDEIAEAVGFLASDKAVSITGVELLIDSGFALTTAFNNKK